jgi:putative DNA primase/helicase
MSRPVIVRDIATDSRPQTPEERAARADQLAARILDRNNLTEDALALEFVHRHRDAYCYVPGWGWMHFEGTHWKRDARLRHFDDARKLCRIEGIAADRTVDEKRIAAAKTIAAVVQLARADQRIVIMPEAFDSDSMALNTPAGIVNLCDATIRPHAGEYLTKCTAVAPAFDREPTTWLRFLLDVFDNDDVIAFVRRLLGYMLIGETREQVIAFCHGEGSNGKSTLLDLMLYIVGNYGLKVPTSTLMARHGERHPTDIAQLCGVRLAVANEVSEGEFWDEGRVKELTGDLKLTGRFMRQDFFQFDATHKFIIADNTRPQLRSMDYAMRRRLLLVPFNTRFAGDDRDPDMLAKLKAEAGAILAWLIIGAADWYESGLEVPDHIRAVSNEYADAMDSLGLWLGECCQRSGDPMDSERASLLYSSYSDWKRGRGESPAGQTRWGESLRGRGLKSYRNNGIWYRGIKLTLAERERIQAAAAARDALELASK